MDNFFAQPITIGNLEIPNRVFLAPLAGVSDVPFRRVCQEFGAGLTYVEMLSARAINYQNKKTFDMRKRHNSEDILGVQVTAPDPEELATAIRELHSEGFDTIDINMGCPVKKVVNSGCGSAITRDTEHMGKMVQAAREQTNLPLSAKFRLGFTREEVNVEQTTMRIIEENLDMYTIHGRTATENYSNPVDLQGIASGVHAGQERNKNIVSVGNGDIFDRESAWKMHQETSCDAIMISRGALGNPWIFKEILENRAIYPTIEEWLEVIIHHLDYHEDHYGDHKYAAAISRKHLVWYAKGFPYFKSLRLKVQQVKSLKEARQIFREFAAQHPKQMVRYECLKNKRSHQGYDPKYEMDRKLDRGVGSEEMG